MLRYDWQTKPGLVALYDIRPGNGAGPFLQPRSPQCFLCESNKNSIVPASETNNFKNTHTALLYTNCKRKYSRLSSKLNKLKHICNLFQAHHINYAQRDMHYNNWTKTAHKRNLRSRRSIMNYNSTIFQFCSNPIVCFSDKQNKSRNSIV